VFARGPVENVLGEEVRRPARPREGTGIRVHAVGEAEPVRQLVQDDRQEIAVLVGLLLIEAVVPVLAETFRQTAVELGADVRLARVEIPPHDAIGERQRISAGGRQPRIVADRESPGMTRERATFRAGQLGEARLDDDGHGTLEDPSPGVGGGLKDDAPLFPDRRTRVAADRRRGRRGVEPDSGLVDDIDDERRRPSQATGQRGRHEQRRLRRETCARLHRARSLRISWTRAETSAEDETHSRRRLPSRFLIRMAA